MSKIVNVAMLSPINIGDMMSFPVDYYNFPLETVKLNVTDLENAKHFVDNYLIWGGGGHYHLPSVDYNNGVMSGLSVFDKINCKKKIMWSIGHNIHTDTIFDVEMTYPKAESFDLVGIRDNKTKYNYVPCVSCKHPIFDKKFKVEKEVVVFGHDWIKGFKDLKFPKIAINPLFDFEQVIEFLGSAETVIANSYHGAYWSLLLGKKVIVNNPHSNKFAQLHENIQFAGVNYRSLKKALADAKPVRGFLKKCRDINDDFYQKVLKLIKED
jgi:hypothetical protein